MKRNQVILIYGLPASGKYTMAKHIQEKCGGILFDNHYFHDMFQNIIYVPEKRRPEYYEKIIMLRATFLDIIKTFYKSKDFTRFIFTSVLLDGDKLPEILKNFADDMDADFIPIGLSAPDDVLLTRCDTPYRKSRKKISSVQKYSKILPNMRSRPFVCKYKNNLIVETGNASENDTLKKILKHLKKFD